MLHDHVDFHECPNGMDSTIFTLELLSLKSGGILKSPVFLTGGFSPDPPSATLYVYDVLEWIQASIVCIELVVVVFSSLLLQNVIFDFSELQSLMSHFGIFGENVGCSRDLYKR